MKINPAITVLPPGSGFLMSVLYLIVETTKSGETLSSCLVNHARISQNTKTKSLLIVKSGAGERIGSIMMVNGCIFTLAVLGREKAATKTRRMIAVNYIYHQQNCL